MASKITNKATAQLTSESGLGKPVVTGPPKPASANNPTRYFDFFGLPRELRDTIYEQSVLFEYENLPTNRAKDFVTKAKKLRTSLLLVSRQFRDEHTERCTGQQVLCIRDHCETSGEKAILSSPNRARFWAIEFFVMSNNTDHDLEMLKNFLDLRAGPDLALRSINIKLLFEDTPREEIESGSVRCALSDLQAYGKVASLKIYLADKLWDFQGSGEPKSLIARWDRSDDMSINFLTPAIEVHDMGSEWGHPSDTVPACCDPSKMKYYGDSEDDEGSSSSTENDNENESGSETDGEDDNEIEHTGEEDDNRDSEHDGEDRESVGGHDDGSGSL